MHEETPTDPNGGVLRLLAVVVLYKMKPSESVAYRTLQAAILSIRPGLASIRTLLYDNTPGGQDIGELEPGVQFKADPKNEGLAKAYNYSLQMAEESGLDWLLTLDQDSELPIEFFSRLYNVAMFVAPMATVGAIVPYMSSDGRVISPFSLGAFWKLTKHFPKGFIGIPTECVYAANSASTLRVSALKAIGGYDTRFFFYFADLVMNHRLHCNDLRFFVAGDIHVEHELSGFDLKSRTTLERYEETCRAEEAAYDECMGRVAGLMLTIRLLYRLVYRLWRIGGSVAHFKIGLRFLFRRLFYSRRHRMEDWAQFLNRRSAAQSVENN